MPEVAVLELKDFLAMFSKTNCSAVAQFHHYTRGWNCDLKRVSGMNGCYVSGQQSTEMRGPLVG